MFKPVNMDDYKLFLRTVQASAIRTLSEVLKDALTETNFYFDETGLLINSMDTTQNSFVHLKLDAPKFNEYYCPNLFHCGINTQYFHKLLKTINNSDMIYLYIEKKNDQCLCIRVENQEKKSVSVTKLNLIDTEETILEIQDIMIESVYNMSSSDFQKNVRDLSYLDKKVKIFSDTNAFKMCASGTFANQTIQIGHTQPDPNRESTASYQDEDGFDYIGTYDLSFLSLFCKASGLCSTLELYLKPDNPLILNYSVAELGSIKFGLSPINDDIDN